ncbi:DMT family transporter [Candidatus Chlorohelix sp.]|uniref:DMT family transporter n=1 Tax=Candidatus Chlorohelix sp. TaxID=3139201 RepID=UPI00303E8EDB
MATSASTTDVSAKKLGISQTSVQGFTFADFLLLICVSIWALNVPLIKSILQYLNPLAVSILRFGVAGLILFGMLWYRERSLQIQLKHLPLMFLCALCGITLNQVVFVYALSNTSASEVSLLMATTPTFAVLVAWIARQEKTTASYWKSLPISLAGVVLIVLTAPGAHLSGGWFGDFLAILTAFSWAAYTVILRPLMRHYSITKLSAYITLIGLVMLLPFGLPQISIEAITNLPAITWVELIYSTLGAVVLTNILWYFGVKRLGGPRTAFYSYLQPFLGVMAAALVLSEQIVIWQLLGGILIILGMLIYRQILSFSRIRKLILRS